MENPRNGVKFYFCFNFFIFLKSSLFASISKVRESKALISLNKRKTLKRSQSFFSNLEKKEFSARNLFESQMKDLTRLT
jgi:hypothetical protein